MQDWNKVETKLFEQEVRRKSDSGKQDFLKQFLFLDDLLSLSCLFLGPTKVSMFLGASTSQSLTAETY